VSSEASIGAENAVEPRFAARGAGASLGLAAPGLLGADGRAPQLRRPQAPAAAPSHPIVAGSLVSRCAAVWAADGARAYRQPRALFPSSRPRRQGPAFITSLRARWDSAVAAPPQARDELPPTRPTALAAVGRRSPSTRSEGSALEGRIPYANFYIFGIFANRISRYKC